MTHRGPFQPLLFCDSVILYRCHAALRAHRLPLQTKAAPSQPGRLSRSRAALALPVATQSPFPAPGAETAGTSPADRPLRRLTSSGARGALQAGATRIPRSSLPSWHLSPPLPQPPVSCICRLHPTEPPPRQRPRRAHPQLPARLSAGAHTRVPSLALAPR